MSELTNQDTYQVYCNNFLSEDKTRVMTLLYQPLCRAEAFALYLTLYHEAERGRLLNTVSTHYRLLKITQFDLQTFQDSLTCLEGLGLIRTFQKKDGRQADYIYEVLMPLTPKRFFDNALLNTLLFNALGETDYEKTKYCFAYPQIDMNKYENVSSRFDEVFHVNLEGGPVLKNVSHLNDEKSNGPSVDYDMSMFYRGLQDYQIPRSVITKDVEKAIIQYGTLYHIAPSVMRELVYDVYDYQKISIDDLKERCLRYYEFEHQSSLKQVVQPPISKKTSKVLASQREKKIQQLSTLNPYEYLRALQNGVNPTARDLALIENLMVNQKLNAGVVNVLVETVLKLNNGQLPRNHLEYLAGLFVRKGVDTVEKAMKEAKTYITEKQAKMPVDIPMATKKKPSSQAAAADKKEYDDLMKEIEVMLKGGGS